MSGVNNQNAHSPHLRSTKRRGVDDSLAHVPTHMTPAAYNSYLQAQFVGPQDESDESDDDDDDESMPKRVKRNKQLNGDPVGGSSCHQCKSRRSTHDLSFCANQLSKKNKGASTACRKKYCDHCLRKFYKEKVPSRETIHSWKCPACRGVCCCAACRKRNQKDKPDTMPSMHHHQHHQMHSHSNHHVNSSNNNNNNTQSYMQPSQSIYNSSNNTKESSSMLLHSQGGNNNSNVNNNNAAHQNLAFSAALGRATLSSQKINQGMNSLHTKNNMVSPQFSHALSSLSQNSTGSTSNGLTSFSTPSSIGNTGGMPAYLSLNANSSPPTHARSGSTPILSSTPASQPVDAMSPHSKSGHPRPSELFAPMPSNVSLLDAIKQGSTSPQLHAAHISSQRGVEHLSKEHIGISSLDLSTSPMISAMMASNGSGALLTDHMFSASSPILQPHLVTNTTPAMASVKPENVFTNDNDKQGDTSSSILSVLHGSPNLGFKAQARTSSLFSLPPQQQMQNNNNNSNNNNSNMNNNMNSNNNNINHSNHTLLSIANTLLESGSNQNIQLDMGVFALCYVLSNTQQCKTKLQTICTNNDTSVFEKTSHVIDALKTSLQPLVSTPSNHHNHHNTQQTVNNALSNHSSSGSSNHGSNNIIVNTNARSLLSTNIPHHALDDAVTPTSTALKKSSSATTTVIANLNLSKVASAPTSSTGFFKSE